MIDGGWERIADVAWKMFAARGYEAVGLREIADALGVRAASLYYHCGGGKQELYTRALETVLADYGRSLAEAGASEDLLEALTSMASWMLERPVIDLQRILHADLAAFEDRALVRRAQRALHDGIMQPFAARFERAAADRVLRRDVSNEVLAGATVALVNGLGFLHLPAGARKPSKKQRADALALVEEAVFHLLHGALLAQE